MSFRQIIFSAVFIGLLTGLLNSGVQMLDVTSIIYEAENYEIAEVETASVDMHAADEEWGPEDGAERILYTFFANVLSAIGFAAILLAIMNQFQSQGIAQLSLAKGFLWGAAGFIAFFAAPALGLSPEIPGTQAAALESRQVWWLFTVVASIAGLATLAFAPIKYKVLGLVCLVAPHLIGAPHISGPEFVHPDLSAVETLTQLHHQFISATSLSNFVFWLALGVLCGYAVKRFDSNADVQH